MHCHQARQKLQQAAGNPERAGRPVQEHLEACENCRAFAEDLRLADLLQELPRPKPPEGFGEQALEQAWQASATGTRRHPGRWLAAAASLLLAVFIGWQYQMQPAGPSVPATEGRQIVELIPSESRTLDILMNSNKDYPDAKITVQLQDGAYLDGYPESQRRLQWDNPILAGNNLLSLPVTLKGMSHSRITVTVSAGNARKEMHISLEALQSGKYTLSIITDKRGLS